MLDIKPLRYFVALAETGHFGRAATRLNLSQPPLSRQIAALEASLGVTLVERGPRGVT
ncbi:LysR family transcriptional regulator, partial [Burkholderia sp. Cy-647]|nr:LysR family transcriptional regulator [Burkholderia sp. Cy-647]